MKIRYAKIVFVTMLLLGASMLINHHVYAAESNFTMVNFEEISNPDDIKNMENDDRGLIYSITNDERGKTVYQHYYKVNISEKSWVFLDRYMLDSYTYYAVASNPTDLYYNASMSKTVIPTYSLNDMYVYYLNPGEYYLRAGVCNCKSVGYGFVLPVSNIISASIEMDSDSNQNISIKFLNGAHGMTRIISGKSSTSNIINSTVWENAQVLKNNKYSIPDRGNYTIRAEFTDSKWLNYPVDIILSDFQVLSDWFVDETNTSDMNLSDDEDDDTLFERVEFQQISQPFDMEWFESQDNGKIYSIVNDEAGSTLYQHYYKFDVAEKSWIIINRYMLDGYTYYAVASNPIDLYYNSTMTKMIPKTKEVNGSYLYYLEPGTYYIRAGVCNCRSVAYGYILPVSKVLFVSNDNLSLNEKNIEVKFLNNAHGIVKMIYNKSTVEQLYSNSVWQNAETLTNNQFTIKRNGDYSFRAEFQEIDWKDYCVDATISFSDIIEKDNEVIVDSDEKDNSEATSEINLDNSDLKEDSSTNTGNENDNSISNIDNYNKNNNAINNSSTESNTNINNSDINTSNGESSVTNNDSSANNSTTSDSLKSNSSKYNSNTLKININNGSTYKKSKKVKITAKNGIKSIKLNKKKIGVKKGKKSFSFKLSSYKKNLKKKGKWNKLVVLDKKGVYFILYFKVK